MPTEHRALIAAALGATVAVAHAQPMVTAPTDVTPARAVASPRLEVTVGGALRVTALDGQAARFAADAMNYGWADADARTLGGGAAAVHYLWTPVVDVGVHLGWLTRAFATSATDDSDRLTVGWRAASVSARLRWAGGRPFVPEPRIDLGLADQRTTVHGVDDHRLRTLLRVGVDWRLGTPRAGCEVSLGYTRVAHLRQGGPSPPLGGLDLAIGPYLRF